MTNTQWKITYEKHDKAGNWTKYESQGFSDYWLASKDLAVLKANNNNIAHVTLTEVEA